MVATSPRTSALDLDQPHDTRGRTTVLLTGFGPFPGVSVNATMRLVPDLATVARVAFPGTQVIAEILPTEWRAAPKCVDRLLTLHQPDVVLHFGVSGRARGFEIETRGHNVCDMAPDAAGHHPPHRQIRRGGDDRLAARIPVAEIVRRLRARGIPAFQSWSAGAYLCNATLYHVLASTAGSTCAAGFVHIPSLLAAPSPSIGLLRASPRCPMSWSQTRDGALEILATCLGRAGAESPMIAAAWARLG